MESYEVEVNGKVYPGVFNLGNPLRLITYGLHS